MHPRLLAAFIFFLIAGFGYVEQDPIDLLLWCELEPMVQENEEYPLSTEAAQKRILEEAREILSGMIYGFRFSYTPADENRQIEEQFILTPVAEILWGDPNLEIMDAYRKDSFLFVKVYYDLQDFQSARRRAWSSNAVDTSSGLGRHSIFTLPSPEGKRLALQEAMKNALRNHLRPIHFNKPREISGELVIWAAPRTVIQSGSYATELDVKLQVKEIRSYSLF